MPGRLPDLFQEEKDPVHQLGYLAKRSGLYMAGKTTAEATGEAVREATHSGMLTGLTAGLANTVAGLLTVGLTAGVSAVLTQMDYVHRRENIRDFYKEELASYLRKPVSRLTVNDLETLGHENRVIHEEMQQIRKQRSFGVGISFLASLAALSLVIIALPAAAAALTGAASGAAAMEALGGAAMIIKPLVGLIGYNMVKQPLHHIADKLFHLDEPTTHDRIVNLTRQREQGRAVTREQVMEVYASANPAIDHMIRSTYGRRFDALPPEKKQQAVQELGRLIPLEQMAADINSGRVNVAELAFAADGQMSGIQLGRPVEEPKKGLMASLTAGIRRTFSARAVVTENRDDGHSRIAAIAQAEATATLTPPDHAARASHVQRLGREARPADMAYLDRLEKQRAEQAALTQQV